MLLSVKAFSCPHSYIYTYKNKNHEDRSYFLLDMKEFNHGKTPKRFKGSFSLLLRVKGIACMAYT